MDHVRYFDKVLNVNVIIKLHFNKWGARDNVFGCDTMLQAGLSALISDEVVGFFK
jgi:hypothetical protein